MPFSKLRLLLSADTAYFPVPMAARDGDNGAAWFVGPGPWFERIRADDLSLRWVTRRFYMETRAMDRFIASRPEAQRIEVPSLYLLVRDDPMMDNERLERFVAASAGDAWVKVYPGGPDGKHFLLYTEDRQAALDDLDRFLRGPGQPVPGGTHYPPAP